MIEGIIEQIVEAGETFANRMVREHDILELIEINKAVYERSYKKNKMDSVVFCRSAHLIYLEEAKRKGLDISIFPEELNYLEMQN